MAAGYYIDKRSAEKEAVDRWENEGGRLTQNHEYILDSVGEDYRRHKGQAMPIERLHKRDDIMNAMLFLASDGRSLSPDRQLSSMASGL